MRCTIVGAGLAGLTLALALKDSEHEVRIFERDPRPDARGQGIYIGLNRDMGLRALDRVGVLSTLESMGSSLGRLCFMKNDGNTLLDLRLPPQYAPLGVSRAALHQVLLEAQRTPIEWGKRLAGYEARQDDVTAHFEDGSQVTSDLLFGCDGLHSRVRAQRVGDELEDLGLCSVRGLVVDADLAANPLLKDGGFISVAGGSSLFVQHFASPGCILWSFTEATSSGLGDLDPEGALAYVASATHDWHEPVARLIEATPVEGVAAPYRLRDRQPATPSEGGRVALLGDAAHPMSPFQGQGGNLALMDAVELAAMLREGASSPTALTARFERAAIERALRPWKSSRRAAVDFHAPDAPERVLQWRNGPLT